MAAPGAAPPLAKLPTELEELTRTLRMTKDQLVTRLDELKTAKDQQTKLQAQLTLVQTKRAEQEARYKDLLAQVPTDSNMNDLTQRLQKVNGELKGLHDILLQQSKTAAFSVTRPAAATPTVFVNRTGGKAPPPPGQVQVFRRVPTRLTRRPASKDGYHVSNRPVSAVPDVYTVTLPDDQDTALILACDGIWDTMNNQDAARLVVQGLKQRVANPARALIERAHERNSQDNLTCIVVHLPPA